MRVAQISITDRRGQAAGERSDQPDQTDQTDLGAQPPPEPAPQPARTPPGTVRVSLDSLRLDGSPRTDGESLSHVQVLAEVDGELPPILVHRRTMQVLDGVHRVRAARLVGRTSIEAAFFDGGEDDAFVKAVEANVTHGLPLSIADRRAAAERIIATHPAWSDRAVAASTGLSAATVRSIRNRSSEPGAHPALRVGRDGRVRPLSTVEGRQQAADLIADRPGASLREIARTAGISLGTARDVRQRVLQGEDPVPAGARNNANTGGGSCAGAGAHNGSAAGTGEDIASAGRRPAAEAPPSVRVEEALRNLRKSAGASPARTPAALLAGLMKDPSLRYTDSGRHMLRWLSSRMVDPAGRSLAAQIPPHCLYTIAEFAVGCAQAWELLASEIWVQAQQAAPHDK